MHPKLTPPLVSLLVVLATTTAHAAGISRFQPAGGPHNYIVTADPQVLRHLSPSLWSVTTYAHHPLVLRNEAGALVRKVVEHYLTLEVGGAIGLFDLLELGATVPAAYFAGDGVDGRGLSVVTAGDPRLSAKLRLTPWDDGLLAALRADVDLPLARWNAKALGLLGDPYPVLRAGGVIGYRGPWLRTALDVGYVLRAPSRVGREVMGHEVRYGVAAEVPLWPDLVFVTGDVYGSVAPSFLFSSSTQLPVEGALGLKAVLGPVHVSAGVGSGLWAGYGTPDARVFAAVAFVPELGAPAAAPSLPPPPAPLEPAVEPDDDGGEEVQQPDALSRDAGNDDDVDEGESLAETAPIVVVTHDTIELDEEVVLFKRESSRIRRRAYPLLRRLAEVLNEHTEIEAVLIEGHTDSTGPDDYNRRLSRWRALSVRRFLIRHGVSPDRLRVRSFADTRPATSNRTAAGRAKNRRVEIHILRGDEITRVAERRADEETP